MEWWKILIIVMAVFMFAPVIIGLILLPFGILDGLFHSKDNVATNLHLLTRY